MKGSYTVKSSVNTGRQVVPDKVPGEQELTLITYNIDGLNSHDLMYRTQCVIAIILSERADVVMVQEVVPSTAPTIIRAMAASGYTAFGHNPPPVNHYFTLTFLHTTTGITLTYYPTILLSYYPTANTYTINILTHYPTILLSYC